MNEQLLLFPFDKRTVSGFVNYFHYFRLEEHVASIWLAHVTGDGAVWIVQPGRSSLKIFKTLEEAEAEIGFTSE